MILRSAFVVLLISLAAMPGPAAPGVPEPEGYRMDDYRAPTPDTVAGGGVVHTEQLRKLVEQGSVILIDVLPAPRRPPEMKPDAPWLPVPRRNLPGSVWLPEVGRGAISPALEDWFRAQLQTMTGGDRSRAIVFYCLADCWMSWNAAKRAAGYGYTHVLWYPEGTDGWHAAGLPLAVSHALVPPE